MQIVNPSYEIINETNLLKKIKKCGIEHLKHITCNVAFLLELEREEHHDKN